MSGSVIFVGNLSYNINPALGTVRLTAAQLDNPVPEETGTIRLELWLTTTPWNSHGTNIGYEVATDQLAGSSNGRLGAYQYFSDIAATVPYVNRPLPGIYFVTLAASEYIGTAPGADDGFVVDSAQTFSGLLVVNGDGSLTQLSESMPTVDVESQLASEGDNGSKDMFVTLTLSDAVPYAVSVQVDTRDETARAGIDYVGQHQRVTFAPGSKTATVGVPILGNSSFQPDRAFEINLSAAIGATVARNYLDPTGTRLNEVQADSWGLIVDDDTPPGVTLPTDAYFGLEWYLYVTRTALAWQHATGKGIKVAIFDQGIDAAHPDLRSNDDVALGRVSGTAAAGGAPLTAFDNHGTHVAGVVAAAKDGEGIVGVAYDAQLVSIYTSSEISLEYLTEIANAFRYASSVDVLNDSWGFGNLLLRDTNWAFLDDAKDSRFAPAFQTLHDLAASGRGGLGTVVVQSAGNAYRYGDDTNLHNFQNSRYIITVGATDYFGASSGFSTTGASILVSAPGGAGNGDFASILTTDRTGAAGSNVSNYAFDDGTSFSSPIVAGIVALMLEVNPRLGYRDVQQILAYTAHQTDIGVGTWAANGAPDWNGGGLRYNAGAQSSGFGQVDALAATRLAATWNTTPQTVANTTEVPGSQFVNQPIPDADPNGINSSITLDGNVTVQRIDVTVNISHPFIGDLELILISPVGTASHLMYRPSQGNLSAVGSSQHDVHFTFDTVLDWGESTAGKWTLNVRDLQSGNVGIFSDWSIDVIGQASSNNHSFVYTNEYPQLIADDPARALLHAPSNGTNTLNASALGSDDRIDLSGATASVINGGNLNIAAGTVVNNAYGGDGNDLLIANLVGSELHGMAGNDVLTGGAGNDRLDGGVGNDEIVGGLGTDTVIYHGLRANYSVVESAGAYVVTDIVGRDGTDQVTQVERLQFGNITIATDVEGTAGQAYRLYQAAFNRLPDMAGLGYWTHVMDEGLSADGAAQFFVESSEFSNLYGPAVSSSQFIDLLYQNVLHRVPDQSGADFWNTAIHGGLTRAQALAYFSDSPENHANLVGVMQNGWEFATIQS